MRNAADIGGDRRRRIGTCGALAQIDDALAEKGDHRLGPFLQAEDLAHRPQGTIETIAIHPQIAVIQRDDGDFGFLLQLDRIDAASRDHGFEDHLRGGRKGQNAFRMVEPPIFAEDGQGLELGIGDRVGPRLEFLLLALLVVDADDSILGLEIDQKAQGPGPRTDDARNRVGNGDRARHGIDDVAGSGRGTEPADHRDHQCRQEGNAEFHGAFLV